MPKLGVLSAFANVRVMNIDTRIENYSEPLIFTDSKACIFILIRPNSLPGSS
jgi:hypothetical protein